MRSTRPALWAVAVTVAGLIGLLVWQSQGSEEPIAAAEPGPVTVAAGGTTLAAGSAIEAETGALLVVEADVAADGSKPPQAITATTVAPSATEASVQNKETSTTSGSRSTATSNSAMTASIEPASSTTATTAAAPTTTTTPTTTAEPVTVRPGTADTYFATLPPGSALPSSAQCASRVRSVPENVAENKPYNQTRGHKVSGTYLSTNTAIAKNDYEQRLDGAFTGSTDEIIQWAACKWGFDEDLLRAQVYTESSWYAGKLGDCGDQTHERTGGNGGCASVGLIQVRAAETGASHHPGVYPVALDSSAMNLDYALAIKRLCFEGQESWLAQSSGYQAGDEWNCMGRWFSGGFGDAGARQYLDRLRKNLNERPWEGQWVGCPNWRESFHCSGISRPTS